MKQSSAYGRAAEPIGNRVLHNIEPVWNEESRILILGSFPSVLSRETGFYYGHPQNRFWRVLASLFGESVPATAAEKKACLLSHGIALWDTVSSCEIVGSSDSSIRAVEVNPIGLILDGAPISRIFTNGKTADRLYRKFLFPSLGRLSVCLPSTSPANAAQSLSDLCDAWRVILADLSDKNVSERSLP